jgi:hypothetical protein
MAHAPRLIQLMHEMAAHQEYMPYLAHKFWPAKVLVLLARSARLEPQCDVKHCLYYTWKDIFVLFFLVGVAVRSAVLTQWFETTHAQRIYLSARISSSSEVCRGQPNSRRNYFGRFLIPSYEFHGGIHNEFIVFFPCVPMCTRKSIPESM